MSAGSAVAHVDGAGRARKSGARGPRRQESPQPGTFTAMVWNLQHLPGARLRRRREPHVPHTRRKIEMPAAALSTDGFRLALLAAIAGSLGCASGSGGA